MSPRRYVGEVKPNWADMSPYVVHFTKSSVCASAYSNSLSILSSMEIQARSRFGLFRTSIHARPCVCLSETPLGQLSRLAERRGSYGIGFRKEFIVRRGGGPILYAYKDTPHAATLESLASAAYGDGENPIWNVAPFVDIPGQYGTSSYFFEWEREWRHVGGLKFAPTDVAFLVIPEELHNAAREFFDFAEREDTGPNYRCPFIDPYWDHETIQLRLVATGEVCTS